MSNRQSGVEEKNRVTFVQETGGKDTDLVNRWMHLMSRWDVTLKAYRASIATTETLGQFAAESSELISNSEAILLELQDLKRQIDEVIGTGASRRMAPLQNLVVGYLDLGEAFTTSGRGSDMPSATIENIPRVRNAKD